MTGILYSLLNKKNLNFIITAKVDPMWLSHEFFSDKIFPPLFILTVIVTVESETTFPDLTIYHSQFTIIVRVGGETTFPDFKSSQST